MKMFYKWHRVLDTRCPWLCQCQWGRRRLHASFDADKN